MRKLHFTLGVPLLVLAGFAVAVPVPANAESPSCYGDSCTDLNPALTNCVNDAVTLWSVNATSPSDIANNYSKGQGVLEMRYSAACHSNWVRFTNWSGIDQTVATFLSGDQISGRPWIWRDGVANTPRGEVGNSGASLFSGEMTKWTAMITADGTTCMSVDLYAFGDPNKSEMGGSYSEDSLGNFTAGCIS